jgi:RNA polymerase sigma-70 factor (ECF subfamily)
MSKRVTEAASLELAFLAALDSIHADVDTSQIAEIRDWSRAVRGKFHGSFVAEKSDTSNPRPRVPNAIGTDAPGSSSEGVSGVDLGASGHMASYGCLQYSQMAIPQFIAVCTSESREEAWTEFVRRFQPLIAGVITKVAHRFRNVSHQLVDDLIQDVYLKLCKDNFRALKSLATFSGESAFFGFLKVMATHTAQDYFRSAASVRGGTTDSQKQNTGKANQIFLEKSSASPDPEREILLAEIDTILKTHAQEPNFERDYAIFWLYYSHGLTAKAISDLPGVNLSIKGVESTLHRLTRQLRVSLTHRAKKPAE